MRKRMLRTGPVLVIGHLPPPVHGMAVATLAFAEVLATVAPVIRLKTASDTQTRSFRHHTNRIWRTGKSVVALIGHRRDARSVYLSADAGLGIVYTLALVATARSLGYPITIHHHSYAYINERSHLLSATVRVGGRECLHLVACAEMEFKLRQQYPRVIRTTVLSLDFVIDLPPEPIPRAPSETVVLGFLSNLTLEKGLALAFDTLDRLTHAGISAELVVAGPLVTAGAVATLCARLQASTGKARYLGPLNGDAKDAFFESIDIFLFPSRYAHESFGIVVREALIHGVPTISYEGGCLRQAALGTGAIVLNRSEPFADQAVTHVRRWCSHHGELQRLAEAAYRGALARRQQAQRDAVSVAQVIARHENS